MSSEIRVLLIDNNKSFSDLAKTELESQSEQITVITEHSAADGLTRVTREDDRIDCIISDYEFSDSTGLDILTEVRDFDPNLPFILFTGHRSEAIASDAISAGVTDYMQKDEHSDQFAVLANRVENVVSQYRATQEADPVSQRLQEIADSTTDCLWMFTKEWDDLLFISGYEEVWHRPAEQIKENPQDFLNGVHPADRDFVKQAMDRLSSGESLDIEYRIQKGTSEQGWVWVKGEPIVDADGYVVRVVGFTRDITDRKVREQELQRSKRRFEAMFNDPNILVGLLDTDGTVQEINETALGYIEKSLSEIKGDRFWQTPWFEGDESLQETIKEYVNRTAAGEYVEFELDLSESLEEDVFISGVFRPVTDANGDIISLLISDRDISERKQREQELELRNQAIQEAPVGVLITDPSQEDNPIIYANDQFVELTGYSHHEILGKNCRFLQGPETSDEPVSKMRQAIDAEEPVTVELKNYRKDGSMFWNRVTISPVYNEEDELSNYIGFQETITERKQRQQQLTVVDRILRHNLRNDMNVIQNRAETLQSHSDDEVATTASQIVTKSEELMGMAQKQRLITQILSNPPTEEEVKLKPLLETVVARIQETYPEAKITLTDSESDTFPISHQFTHVVEELLENAIHHSESQEPVVEVMVSATDEAVSITVEDAGPPIPEMERDVLLGREETPLFHGSGLGLWLIYLIVSQLEGYVTHEETESHGNVIEITLPK